MAREVGRLEFAGTKELIANIERLGGNIKTGAGQALAAAARPIVAQAKTLVPRNTGLLRRSLGVVVRKPKAAKAMPYAAIGARRGFKEQVASTRGGKPRYANPAKYAHLVERGTSAHDIPIPVYTPKSGLPGFKVIKHPGAKAKPFLEPAVVGGSAMAASVLKTKLAEVVAKYKAKVLTL